jgi:twinkle protein
LNAHELSQRMADDAAGIAAYLLPKGKRSGGEWKAGSVHGEEGESLSVRLSGAKRGLWKDFAADEGGDLLDLWAAARSLSLAEAMVEAKQYLGVRDQMPARERPSYKRPSKPQCHTPKPESKVKQWLNGRGITDACIEDFKIAEQGRDGKTIAVFPYLRDGELVNAKYRDIADKKGMRQEGGAEPCLFGWHLIDPRARSVAITEGEIDCMTLHQFGIPALSVNAGAGNHQWIENDWERLERFSEVFVCFDDDDAGRKGSREVIQRLGIDRCKPVKFGAKDANQWLLDGADGEEFHAALKAAKPVDPDELVSIADFFGQVKALMYPAQKDSLLPRLMVGDRYEDAFEFRPGELTVWTGINGHGKSLMLNQVLIGVMNQNGRVCVFSGEMSPAQQGRRIVRQCSGSGRPTPAYIDAIGDWLRDRMWLFNVVGTATIDRLAEVFKYAAKRYGITHFVIDSLMMTDVPEDGPGALSAQKKALQTLTAFAKQHQAHVHLVAHPRKGRDEATAPGKMDVGGSGKITDTADNVFSVWSARKEDSATDDEDDSKPDALLELHKQRNGDVQHRKFWLWFHRGAQQYTATPARRPKSFVAFNNPSQAAFEEAV